MKKALYLLSKLTDADVAWLTQAGFIEDYANGHYLIRQGEPIANLYIILDGRARIMVEGIGEVATLSTGEIVGEVSFVDDRPPSASVVAEDSLSVLTIPRNVIQKQLNNDDGFGSRFYHSLAMFLSDRLRAKTQAEKAKEEMMSEGESIGELNLDRLEDLTNTGEKFIDILKTARRRDYSSSK